jgi:peptide/nickel transport system permease protein
MALPPGGATPRTPRAMSPAALGETGGDDGAPERPAPSGGLDSLIAAAASPWSRFAARRLGQLLISVLVLVTASFLMIHLVPGDPVRAALGLDASQGVVNARRAALGLNDPLWLQYVHYLRDLLSGKMGDSITSGLPVAQTIGQRLPATLELAGYAFGVAIIVAIPLGLTMGVVTRGGRRRGAELSFTAVAVVLGAIPGFLLAFGLIDVFSVQLGWTPVALQGGFSSYALPVLSLAIGPAVILARILRLEVLAALQADYVRTARAKRLPSARLYLGHVLPNALTATITVCGLLLAGLVAGTVLIENVFAWPGLGQTMVASIISKDYPVVQGIVLVYGTGVLLVNLAVDVTLALLDPRSTIREA